MFEQEIKNLINAAAEQAAEKAAQKAFQRFLDIYAASPSPSPRPIRYGNRMTVEELMAATGYKRQTIYQKNHDGVIPGAVKVGAKLMFITAEVMPWIEGKMR